MSNSLCLSGSVARRVLELADSLGLSPEDYVNALLERACLLYTSDAADE